MILAAIAAVVNFMFIPVYPLWSITVVVIAIVVIYTLVAHGKDGATTAPNSAKVAHLVSASDTR